MEWLRDIGLSDNGINIIGRHLSSNRVKQQVSKFKNEFPKEDRPLFLECYPTHLICVSVDLPKLHASITFIAFSNVIPRLATLLEGISSSLGLIIDEVTEECLDLIKQCQNLTDLDIIHHEFAHGTPPIPQKPPQLKLHVKPFTEKPAYDENDDGSVDFHNLNLFQNVIENQHIADYLEGQPGLPGRDVFGVQIHAGNNKHKPISCGPGMAYDEKEKQFFSTAAGYVTFQDNKLSVKECYIVEKDVDLGVGNINFVSDVSIRGDVLPDFSIQAGRNIEIMGAVTGAMLHAEKDIKLQRGILGQGKSIVKAGGHFKTKFANETIAEIHGDIEILSEALNSELGSSNTIEGRNAVFIGGRMVSIKEMHLGTVGSELGIHTEVFLGQDFGHLKRTDEIRKTLLEMEDLIDGRMEGLRPSIDHWQSNRSKESKNIETLDITLKRLQELQALLNEFVLENQEYELLSQNTPHNKNPVCYIYKKVFPGTVFYCSGDVLRIREKMEGPLTIKAEERSRKGRYKMLIEEGIH